jgi:enoyl-CoA hydratase
MQADLCIASDSARFYYPEAKLGLGRGLMASIVGRIPHKVAAELMLVAEPIAAQRMEHHGLVNRLMPEDEVIGEARRMAAILADRESVVNEFYKYSIEWMLPKGPGEISERTRWLSNQLPGHRTP